MSNIFIDPCNLDKTELFRTTYELWRNFYADGASSVFPDRYYNPNVTHIEPTLDGYNFEALTCECTSSNANMMDFYNRWYKAKYTKTGNRRICLVRFKYKVTNYYSTSSDSHYESYIYFPLANCSDIYQDFVYLPQGNTNTRRNIFLRANGTGQIDDLSLGNYATTMDALSVRITELKSNIPFITPANLEALIGDNTYAPRYQTSNNYNHAFCGIPLEVNRSYGGFECITQIPDTIPVFEETATQAILNYLANGDDSGRVDPYDPNNPAISKVTDYKTNFKVSLTPASNKNGVKVSVIAYNAQYIAGGDAVAGTCCLHGESKLGTETSYKGIGDNSLPKYPQITKTFDLIVDSSSNRWIYFVFRNVDDVNSHGTWFGVDLVYSDKSASHCKIALVTGGDAINSGGSCTRSSITDGYRYTRTSTGEYVDVVFRAFDMDDLNDPYNDDDDTENTESGSEVDSGVGGKGLRTYAISNTQFEDINTALWSTDWTTVFKSNTINPLNCVMACKSIPFTASAISGGVVTIANLNTNVSANYVTPIKTFSCGSLSIDKYNKDFTDLTHTKVRVYMPYIGWRELPAIEVIGRVAVPKCGLVAHNKTLAFKYVVDFVDGNCRCVISVNGTERYYFDGNCSIDVPVTSDNHTTAVGNAIKAGVQTVMSIGAGVASGFAGNAVGAVGGAISALQSAPNVIPTYQYSATSSPSGYIDASMPQKIIIVIERPVYTVPDNYAHTAGRPCALTLSLGSLTGYTKCANVDISGVSGSDRQRSEVKQLLESGVYL